MLTILSCSLLCVGVEIVILLKLLLATVVVLVVFVVSLAIYLVLKFRPIRGDVPTFKTPAWAFKDFDDFHEEVMLRRETKGGGSLLIKRTDLETVYRYDPQERTLNAAGDAEWQKADGPIAKCFDYFIVKPARDVVSLLLALAVGPGGTKCLWQRL